jgi:hypothetical protein
MRVRDHAELLAPHDGDVRVAASIGPSDTAVTMWSAPEDAAALTATASGPGGVTYPDTRTGRPVRTTIVTRGGDAEASVTAEVSVVFPAVQPLPGGRFLVVGARCRWSRDGAERNAVVYGSDGTVLAEQTLGDGIEHVLTSGRGAVWVGYFDEGVFGNFGWGDRGSPAPIGACGLARYTAALAPAWRFPSDGGPEAISDCYALNVSDETAWACYYTDFPVVRIRDGEVTAWRNDVHGAKALAVGGSRVALFGGYGPDRDRLVVGDLVGDRLHVSGEYRVVRPDGGPLPKAVEVIGRGADLHLLTASAWWRLAVDDLPAGSRN